VPVPVPEHVPEPGKPDVIVPAPAASLSGASLSPSVAAADEGAAAKKDAAAVEKDVTTVAPLIQDVRIGEQETDPQPDSGESVILGGKLRRMARRRMVGEEKKTEEEQKP